MQTTQSSKAKEGKISLGDCVWDCDDEEGMETWVWTSRSSEKRRSKRIWGDFFSERAEFRRKTPTGLSTTHSTILAWQACREGKAAVKNLSISRLQTMRFPHPARKAKKKELCMCTRRKAHKSGETRRNLLAELKECFLGTPCPAENANRREQRQKKKRKGITINAETRMNLSESSPWKS